jgi:hypothetical protein
MLSAGQEFDLVVNIDGFNEVALSFVNVKNELEATMPSFFHTRPLTELADNRLSDEMLRLTLGVGTTKKRLRSALDRKQRTRSGAVHLVAAAWVRLESRRLNWLSAEFVRLTQEPGARTDESVFHFPAPPPNMSNRELGRQVAKHWAKSSTLMKALLARLDVAYVHVLQPNQYFATGRRFEEAERRVAFSPTSSFRPGVEIGYPRLLEEADTLEANGVAFFDATNLFDSFDEAAYADDCCHYTPRGKEALSAFVAAAIIQELEERSDRRLSP